ncbi:MAG: hypothetical protein A3A33_00935 [Candidatus Yanofskybacteria bacterium RIFCSPLOWO2_01_FULL_49_25]|uniref:Uncharacterized protein n=1 Tax=Candidatus Yanofskybacteria bacterium RIFCSPLOWO2_01_FULL_49_25 TaxID=1802701 RepID=A0A1F8GYV6_9BACT|nr:MAG: hypothetical protein A3A33_00935 [Candidatus Yanofskybacteria bacterium RIFCSPLOWO2_01_FULL_49_25]
MEQQKNLSTVVRWILIPLIAVALSRGISIIIFLALLVGIVDWASSLALYGFLFTSTLMLAGSITAPQHKKQAAFVLWILATLISLIYMREEVSVMALYGSICGGALALILMKIWSAKQSLSLKKRIAILSTIFLVLVGLGYARYKDFPSFPDPLPHQLRNISGIREFHVVALGGFIDEDFVWRIDTDGQTIERVASILQARATNDVPKEFLGGGPYWWPKRLPKQYRAFRSEWFVADRRGSDGVHYFLLYDQDQQRGYVWVKNNF